MHDDRHIKSKITTYSGKVYANFCGLNVPKGGLECESCTGISIYFLLVYKSKYYLQVCSETCAYKSAIKQGKNDRIS